MEITKRPSIDFTRIFDIVQYQIEKYPNNLALNISKDGQWKGYSIQTIKEKAEAIACWFIENGFNREEKVIIVPIAGSPEWMMIDFACQQAGLIVVPVHPTSRAEEIALIFSETQARLCITADPGLYNKFSSIAEASAIKLKCYHITTASPGYFPALTTTDISPQSHHTLNILRDAISEDDVFTILYTSGSSGVPKGVLLTHRNVIHNIKAILSMLPLEPGDRVISFLPFSHIFERMTCYTYLAFGVSLYFCQDKESFAHDFKTVRRISARAFQGCLKKCMITLKNSCWIKTC